ncbi:MAG: S41 family peptidase [Cellulophaga sp.]
MRKLVMLFLGFGLIVSSCKKNDDDGGGIKPEPDAKVEVQDFMWKALNQWYFWQADVPDLADNRFSDTKEYTTFLAKHTNPEKFYNDVLLFTDDRFSFLNEDYKVLVQSFAGISKSNGLDFGLIRFADSDDIFGYVRYIVAGSDAAGKDINRGDIFTGVNGQTLNINNYRDLLFGDSDTYILNMATITNGTVTDNSTEVSLTKQESLVENPVFITKTIEKNGIKIGYIMYNSFTRNFDEELNNAFGQLKSDGVTELVLDMRYNPGGSVNTSRLLASMIYGTKTNDLYIRQRWNAKIQAELPKEHLEDYFAATTGDGTAINTLNLSKVYVLATNSSASASELVMNGLAPYIDIVHIGEKTRGKNEFSITLVDIPSNNYIYNASKESQISPTNKWGIQPLVGRNENSAGFSDYTDGLVPDIELEEDLENLGVLGDPTEPLLKKAIDLITASSSKTDFTVKMPAKSFTNSKMFTATKDNMYLDKPLNISLK